MAADPPELKVFQQQMTATGIPAPVVQSFARLYRRYREGDPGKLPWEGVSEAGPDELVPYAELPADCAEQGLELLPQLVVISLNGGLGTTMKLERAKSLITVRDGMSFLELTARHVLRLRERTGHPVPWLLMDSYHTRDDSMDALSGFPDLRLPGLPLDFLQHRFPRIVAHSKLPLDLDPPEVNWAPPGHGDIYLALQLIGLLEQLLERGVRWAFVSNIDNLGGTVDPAILGFMAQRELQFVMEVTDRTVADIKGGPLIRYRDPRETNGRSRLMLLERSQVEPERMDDFCDLERFPIFNTNSLWWRLDAVLERMRAGGMNLPMIVNPKRVQGVDVVQLETAMGAGVGAFERAVGVWVPRSRFAPVKATTDLLGVRSDAFVLDRAEVGVRPNPQRSPQLGGPPVVELDPRYYKGIHQLDARIPEPPSLVACRSLTVEGDVRFGAGVRIEGDVVIRNRGSVQRELAPGTQLCDEELDLS